MFSDGGGADEDDFGEFGSGNRKLASLFGGFGGSSDGAGSRRNSTSPGGASSDLKYSAPKQPAKASRGASMAASAGNAGGVMYALPVHAHRYVDGRPVNEGSLGAAVVAVPSSSTEDPRRFHLLLYKANKQPVTTATISAKAPTLNAGGAEGSNYVQFNPDAQGNSWSMTVNSAAESYRFCAHLALAQALSACSGPELTALHVMDTVSGEGAAVGPDDGIEIKYTGWLVQGTTQLSAKPFDSNVEKDSYYRLKIISKASVIPGWSEGVVGMRKGGQRVLVIPPSLGYGGKGTGDGRIPPGATLVFYLSAGRVKIIGGGGGEATDAVHPKSSTFNSESSHPYSADLPTSFSLPPLSNDVPARKSSQVGVYDSNRRDSTSSSVAEEDVSHGRKSLMSRMAKMGQAILPPPSQSVAEVTSDNRAQTPTVGAASGTAPLAENSTPWMMNGNHQMNGFQGSTPAVHSSVMIMTPQGLAPAPMQPVSGETFLASSSASSSQAIAPYVGGSAAQQMMLATQGMLNNTVVPQHLAAQHQPQQLPQSVSAPSNLDSQLAPILVSENRQQNTEVRMSIDKVLTKMDEMRAVMTSLEQKVSASSTPATDSLAPAMEVSVLQTNLSRIINENTSMKEMLVAKSRKIEELNKRIGEILSENQAFVEQSHKQLIARNSSLVTSSASTESRVLELENERLELTRQLGDRVAELANCQRLLRESEVKEKDISDKLDQLQMSLTTNERSAREDALTARELTTEVEKLRNSLKAAEKEEKKVEGKMKATEEELVESKKETERLRRGLEEAKMKWAKEREEMERDLEATTREKQAELEEWKSKIKKERSSTDALARSTVADLEKQLEEEFAEKIKRQNKLMKEKMAAAMAELEEEKAARDEVIEAAKRKIATLKEALSSARSANQTLSDDSAQIEEEKNALQEKYKKLYKNVGLLKAKYEEKLEETENEKSGLETKIERLETQLDESRSAAISAERRLKLKTSSEDATDSNVKVKKILSSTYHEIKRNIDPGQEYFGEVIHKTILDTIRNITLDAATSEDNDPTGEAKSVEEPEVSITSPPASKAEKQNVENEERDASLQSTADQPVEETPVVSAQPNIGLVKAAAYVQSLATEHIRSDSSRGSFSSEGSSSFETAVVEDAVAEAEFDHSSVSVYGDYGTDEAHFEEAIKVDADSSPLSEERFRDVHMQEAGVFVGKDLAEEEKRVEENGSKDENLEKSGTIASVVSAPTNEMTLTEERSIKEPRTEGPDQGVSHSCDEEALSSRNVTPTPDANLEANPVERIREYEIEIISGDGPGEVPVISPSITQASGADNEMISDQEVGPISSLVKGDDSVEEKIVVEDDPPGSSNETAKFEPENLDNSNCVYVDPGIDSQTRQQREVKEVVKEAIAPDIVDHEPDDIGFSDDIEHLPRPPTPPPLNTADGNDIIEGKNTLITSNSARPKSSSLFGLDDDDDDDASLFFGGSKATLESKSRASSKESTQSNDSSSKEGRSESFIVKNSSSSTIVKPQPPPLIFDDDDDDDLDWLQ